MAVLARILSGYARAAGAQSRIAWTASIATGPWQLVGEQVLIGCHFDRYLVLNFDR
jgi:hypothetical protein